jgi:hypothetical protein
LDDSRRFGRPARSKYVKYELYLWQQVHETAKAREV